MTSVPSRPIHPMIIAVQRTQKQGRAGASGCTRISRSQGVDHDQNP